MISNKSKSIKKSIIKTVSSSSKTSSSLKKTKKNSRKNSRKTKKKSNVLVDILYNSKNPNEIVDKLRNFYKTHIDNEKFLKYEKEFIPFDKSAQGKSGSIVGYLKNKPDSVLKVHYLKINLNKLIYYDGCVKLSNKFNEIFMNIIFKNIKYLPNFTSKEVKEVKNHILEIEDFGFGNNSFYTIAPLVGINYKDEAHKNHFITNFRDIINLNHIPFLKKALNENNTEILKLYDEFIAQDLFSLFNVFKILQKNLNYINADAKLENIFIKSKKNIKSKFNKLREYGIQIDYVLLLSDLEKSRINIENLKFLTYDNYNFIPNFIVKFIVKFMGYQMIRSFRHSCNLKMTKICPKLILNDFDILYLIIDLYTRLISIDENFLNNTPKITELYKQFLSIKDTDYNKLIKILIKGKYNLNTKISRKISKIITKIC